MKLSIIIPVCNTEGFLSRCLDSVLLQTYYNLELIVVNDNSEINCSEIVKKYMFYDSRVILVENIEHKGLLLSIAEGMKYATGDAFTFLNASEQLARDTCRRYVNYISKGFDVVQCNVLEECEDLRYFYQNNMVRHEVWDRNSLLDHFFSQEGHRDCYFSIKNKAYSMGVWNKSKHLIYKFNKNISTGEDVFLSFVFNLVVNVQHNIDYFGVVRHKLDGYYICDEDVIKKELNDLTSVFCFIDKFVIKSYKSKLFETNFQNWRDLYSRIWFDKIAKNFECLLVKNRLIEILKFGLEEDNSYNYARKYDHYAYSTKTLYNENYENLISLICEESTQCIVFDIFDGIILRKTFESKDVFLKVYLLATEKGIITPSFNFVKHRVNAERTTSCLNVNKNEKEKLNNIYSKIMEEHPYLSKESLSKVKQIEKEVKMESIIKTDMLELVDLCHQLNKKYYFVYDSCVSDIELESLLKEVLSNIKLNFKSNIIASDCRHYKDTFESIFDKSNIPFNSNILYVGGGVDIVRHIHLDKKIEIKTWETLSSFDLISGNTSHCKGDLYGFFLNDHYYYSQVSEEIKNVYIRIILSIIKNKLFSSSCFSISNKSLIPYGMWGIGLSCLGPYVHAIVNWLYKLTAPKKQRIIFLSRDGFLIKEAFKVLYPEVEVEYLRISRSSIISSLLSFKKPEEELTNLVEYKKFTPKKLLQNLLPTININNMSDSYFECIGLDEFFISNIQMIHFFRKLISNDLYKHLLMEQSNSFIAYIKSFNISDVDFIFDIGYKGTASYYINKISETNATFSFLYTKSDRSKIYNSKVVCFHNRVPHVSGAMREFMLSEASNKTIFYEKNKPVLQADRINASKIISKDLQLGALEFISESKSYLTCYNDYIFNYEQGAIFIDHFLNHNYTDHRNEFSHITFEDDVSSKNGLKYITEYWPVIFQ